MKSAPTRSFQKPTPTGGSHRVLIVDDDVTLARAMSRSLTVKGYDVQAVSSGDEAIETLRAEPFDVLVSDVHMPGLSGIELLEAVRAHDLDLPVIMMTADPSEKTAAEAVELGAMQYLTKPISAEYLCETVARAVRLHAMLHLRRQALRELGVPADRPADRIGRVVTLRRTLETMWMAFQPIVAPQSGKVFAYEALMRSREPILPHPGAVLEAAESCDRLQDVGRRVRQLTTEAWVNAPEGALLFLNVHTKDLLDPELLDPPATLRKIASRVVLELTERASLDQVPDVRTRIVALRNVGFRLAIDDLGAGYAGLNAFASVEPEFVKIDMALVRDVHHSQVKAKLIESVSMLCRDLGTEIIGEGVEVTGERDELSRLGVRLQQGYLFARPTAEFVDLSRP